MSTPHIMQPNNLRMTGQNIQMTQLLKEVVCDKEIRHILPLFSTSLIYASLSETSDKGVSVAQGD